MVETAMIKQHRSQLQAIMLALELDGFARVACHLSLAIDLLDLATGRAAMSASLEEERSCYDSASTIEDPSL